MKKLMIIIFAAFVLLNTSCLPDKCCEPPHANIYLFAQRNGIQWLAYPADFTVKNDTITISGIGENAGSIADSLGIKIKYTGPGNYKLLKNQVSYYYTNGHSTPVLSYKLDSLYDNNINIINYDQAANILNGTFNIKFTGINTTDDLSFLGGQFYIPLHK
jgi:hypothetical protein